MIVEEGRGSEEVELRSVEVELATMEETVEDETVVVSLMELSELIMLVVELG